MRPAGLFDIPLINRLQRQGVQLDPRKSLTRPDNPLAAVLRGPLTLSEPAVYTYVMRLVNSLGRTAGFVQLRCRKSSCHAADVDFIAPAMESDALRSELWTRLLESSAWEAACNGVERIYANLPADTEDAIPFLNAGFMIFAREEILVHAPLQDLPPATQVTVREQGPADVWTLQRLYARVIPLGVKQAEGLCELDEARQDGQRAGQGRLNPLYVLEMHGDVVGHLQVLRGRVGHWMHFALDPDLHELGAQFVSAGLRLVPRDGLPIYTHVRTYESGLRPALLAQGFELLDRRDVALRQTVARVKLTAPAVVRGMERCPEITTGATLSRAK